MSPRTLRRWGWIIFGLMWVPFTAVFISIISMPEGSYSWQELPVLSRYSVIATGALFIAAMSGLLGALAVGWLGNRRILQAGQRGEGRVIEIWDTGATINEHPVVGLKLEVHPMAGAPFVAETETLMPRLMVARIQPGARLPVRCDPLTKSVALDLKT